MTTSPTNTSGQLGGVGFRDNSNVNYSVFLGTERRQVSSHRSLTVYNGGVLQGGVAPASMPHVGVSVHGTHQLHVPPEGGDGSCGISCKNGSMNLS